MHAMAGVVGKERFWGPPRRRCARECVRMALLRISWDSAGVSSSAAGEHGGMVARAKRGVLLGTPPQVLQVLCALPRRNDGVRAVEKTHGGLSPFGVGAGGLAQPGWCRLGRCSPARRVRLMNGHSPGNPSTEEFSSPPVSGKGPPGNSGRQSSTLPSSSCPGSSPPASPSSPAAECAEDLDGLARLREPGLPRGPPPQTRIRGWNPSNRGGRGGPSSSSMSSSSSTEAADSGGPRKAREGLPSGPSSTRTKSCRKTALGGPFLWGVEVEEIATGCAGPFRASISGWHSFGYISTKKSVSSEMLPEPHHCRAWVSSSR
eukprot:RCo041839